MIKAAGHQAYFVFVILIVCMGMIGRVQELCLKDLLDYYLGWGTKIQCPMLN